MDLKKGSSGDDVIKLQNFLKLKADGDFGNVTELAVKAWQVKSNLPADGKVNNDCWQKMGFDSKTIDISNTHVDNSFGLKLENLKGKIPDIVLVQIPQVAVRFGIDNNLKLAHFLAQCSHESGNFKATVENLNYSAEGLKKTFGKYFTDELAAQYAKKPEKIASRVYANRMGNGSEETKDGYVFRGRGYIQLTGKNNYTLFTKMIGEDVILNPDLVAEKYPLASAAFFFKNNNLWKLCDKGSSDEIVTLITKKVNNGINGLSDRINYFHIYYNLLK